MCLCCAICRERILPRVAESRTRGIVYGPNIGVLRTANEGYNVASLPLLRALKGQEGVSVVGLNGGRCICTLCSRYRLILGSCVRQALHGAKEGHIPATAPIPH